MSDARRVKKVRSIKNALEKLLKLAPVEYKFQDNDPDFIPDFIAQDLHKVFPQFVSKIRNNDNGVDPIPPAEQQRPGFNKGWSVPRLDVLVPFIIGAIQEMAADLDQVKKRAIKQVKDLTDKVTILEARIAALEAAVPVNQQKIVILEDRVTALENNNETLP
jgi:Chaperone of endosialidase